MSIVTNNEFRVLFENDPVVCFIERTRAIRNLRFVYHAQLRTRLRIGYTPCQMEAQANLEMLPGNCMPQSVNRIN